MNKKTLYSYRLYFTGIITVAIWFLLIWTHYNGGVQSHHLMHREELPAVSNWWSGLSIPLFTWILLGRIQKRMSSELYDPLAVSKWQGNIITGFVAALCYGILIAVLFSFRVQSIPGYLMLGILLIALFYPVYRAECMLGFVLGMTVSFGGFIPILVACIFAAAALLIYRFIRPLLMKIFHHNNQPFHQ